MKIYNCKVGTIPSRIILRHNYKIKEGQQIIFRFYNEREWRDGEIWKVNEDGYFFVRRM